MVVVVKPRWAESYQPVLPPSGNAALHRTFHLKLIEACGLRYLLASCSVVYDQFDRYRRLAVRAARRHPKINDVHQRLTDTVLEKKADVAVKLLTEHIRDAEAQ